MAVTPKPKPKPENTGCLVRAEFAVVAGLMLFGAGILLAGLF